MRRLQRDDRFVPLPDACTAANGNNVRCIHVPVEEPPTASIADCSLRQIAWLDGAFEITLNVAYLFERRQVAGAVPNAFLKAREKAASEL